MAKQRTQGRTVDVVEQLIAPTAQSMELLIWDVTFEREGAEWILRILLDSEDGVDLEAAERFSRAIDPLLDEADPIDQSYSLEVCSTGLNRQLTRDWHYEACAGYPVLFRTIRPLDESGVRDFSGTLLGADKENVRFDVDGAEVSVPRGGLAFVKLDDFDEDEED